MQQLQHQVWAFTVDRTTPHYQPYRLRPLRTQTPPATLPQVRQSLLPQSRLIGSAFGRDVLVFHEHFVCKYGLLTSSLCGVVQKAANDFTFVLPKIVISTIKFIVYVIVSLCDFFIKILNSCDFSLILHTIVSIFSVHFFKGKFKTTATVHQNSYNCYIFGNKWYRNLTSESI